MAVYCYYELPFGKKNRTGGHRYEKLNHAQKRERKKQPDDYVTACLEFLKDRGKCSAH